MVFTAEKLRVSTVSMVSLKTKFEGVPQLGGSTYIGVTGLYQTEQLPTNRVDKNAKLVNKMHEVITHNYYIKYS